MKIFSRLVFVFALLFTGSVFGQINQPSTGSGSSFPVTSAQSVNTSGSISPAGVGQIAANQVWLPAGIQKPAVTASNAGSMSGNPAYIGVTYNTAAGETMLGSIVSGAAITGSCTGGTCAYTITAPTLPSGVTGYTAYECDSGSTPTFSPGVAPCTLLKVNTCSNIVTNCTITTSGAGAAAPVINTAWVQPPGIQATDCPASVIPSMFLPDNSGNYRTIGGVEPNSNNSQTTGTWEICHRTWFNDEQTTPPFGHNAFVLIDHSAGVGTSNSNQDRALWVGLQTPTNDTTTHYALEAIQSELDYTCTTCNINGSPDGEVTDASFNTTENAATSYAPNSFGANVIRATFFKSGVSGSTTYSVLNGAFVANNSAFSAGTQIAIVRSSCSGAMNNALCFGLRHVFNASTTAAQAALYVPNGSLGGTSNFLVVNDIPALRSFINGPITFSGFDTNNVASFAINASTNTTGAQTVSQIPTPAAPASVVCSGGASTYSYKFVAVDGNGGTVASTVQNSGGTCTNPLTVGNPATVNIPGAWNTFGTITPAVRVDVYRTGGPMTTGKIGSLTCSAQTGFSANPCNTFSDTGLAADGGTAPSVNTTGSQSVAGYAQNSGNKFFVAANFTTAANTSLQTITGLVFNLLPVAANYQFHCALSYSQATANAAVAFGIQAATVNPTNIFANGTEQITVGPPATFVTGTLATLATTTATNIVSGTPTALATNYTTQLDGTIENPANDAGQVVNIMVSTAAGADAVTVLRGSYCYLY